MELIELLKMLLSVFTLSTDIDILLVGANPNDHGHKHLKKMFSMFPMFPSCRFFTASPDLNADDYLDATATDCHFDFDLTKNDLKSFGNKKFSIIIIDHCVLCHICNLEIPNPQRLLKPLLLPNGFIISEKIARTADKKDRFEMKVFEKKSDYLELSENLLYKFAYDPILPKAEKIAITNYLFDFIDIFKSDESITKACESIRNSGNKFVLEDKIIPEIKKLKLYWPYDDPKFDEILIENLKKDFKDVFHTTVVSFFSGNSTYQENELLICQL